MEHWCTESKEKYEEYLRQAEALKNNVIKDIARLESCEKKVILKAITVSKAPRLLNRFNFFSSHKDKSLFLVDMTDPNPESMKLRQLVQYQYRRMTGTGLELFERAFQAAQEASNNPTLNVEYSKRVAKYLQNYFMKTGNHFFFITLMSESGETDSNKKKGSVFTTSSKGHGSTLNDALKKLKISNKFKDICGFKSSSSSKRTTNNISFKKAEIHANFLKLLGHCGIHTKIIPWATLNQGKIIKTIGWPRGIPFKPFNHQSMVAIRLIEKALPEMRFEPLEDTDVLNLKEIEEIVEEQRRQQPQPQHQIIIPRPQRPIDRRILPQSLPGQQSLPNLHTNKKRQAIVEEDENQDAQDELISLRTRKIARKTKTKELQIIQKFF